MLRTKSKDTYNIIT